jgi:hypothetical protein
MRNQWILVGLVGCAAAAYAKQPQHNQSGVLLRMDSVPCGTSEKDAKSLTGELLGTDSGSKKSEQLLCQEYVLQTETVVYRLRPRDEKHPMLLPIGNHAQFRLDKDKLVLRVEDLDDKERVYTVVSMAPRTELAPGNAVAENTAHRLTVEPQK